MRARDQIRIAIGAKPRFARRAWLASARVRRLALPACGRPKRWSESSASAHSCSRSAALPPIGHPFLPECAAHRHGPGDRSRGCIPERQPSQRGESSRPPLVQTQPRTRAQRAPHASASEPRTASASELRTASASELRTASESELRTEWPSVRLKPDTTYRARASGSCRPASR
jgi:hypothetical protein